MTLLFTAHGELVIVAKDLAVFSGLGTTGVSLPPPPPPPEMEFFKNPSKASLDQNQWWPAAKLEISTYAIQSQLGWLVEFAASETSKVFPVLDSTKATCPKFPSSKQRISPASMLL